MPKSIFRAAGRGRRVPAVLAVAALSVGLHGLVLRWGASSTRHASPSAAPAVVVAALPRAQPRPRADSQPPQTTPVPQAPPSTRRPPPRPVQPPRAAARADGPMRAASSLPAGPDSVSPAVAPSAEVRPGADDDAARSPVAAGSDGPLAVGPDASADPKAASATVALPPVEAIEAVEPVATQASGPASTLPAESIELRFDAYFENPGGDTRIGDARFSLLVADGRYRMTLEASGPLSRFAYASSGLLGDGGFEPHRFSESRRVAFRARVERSLTLVAPSPAGVPPASPEEAPGEPPTEAVTLQVPPGTQDRLSVLFQLWLLMRADPGRLAEGREIAVWLASMKGHERATFRVGPVETVLSGTHPVAAVRLTRVPGSARASGIEVWLAAQAPHLPVGLRYVERDRAVRFVATGPA